MQLLEAVSPRSDAEGFTNRFDRCQAVLEARAGVDLPVRRQRALHNGHFGEDQVEEVVEAAESAESVVLENDEGADDGGRELELVQRFFVRRNAARGFLGGVFCVVGELLSNGHVVAE